MYLYGHGTTDWFQIGKGVRQGCILSPCLFNLYASWNQDCWEKYQYPQICRWHHTYGRKQRRTKESLDESERGEWIGWLKAQHSENEDHAIWSHHFMANRWGTSGNSERLYFGGGSSRITADGDCSHEIKRCLLLGRKAMPNPDSILKSRDITLLTNVCLVKAMVFPDPKIIVF